MEPNPGIDEDSRYVIEGVNASSIQDVPDSNFTLEKVVPNCSSGNLNRSAFVFEVGGRIAILLVGRVQFEAAADSYFCLPGSFEAAGISRHEG